MQAFVARASTGCAPAIASLTPLSSCAAHSCTTPYGSNLGENMCANPNAPKLAFVKTGFRSKVEPELMRFFYYAAMAATRLLPAAAEAAIKSDRFELSFLGLH